MRIPPSTRYVLSLGLLGLLVLLAGCVRHPRRAARDLVREGQAYMKRGKYRAAAIEFRRAIQLEPRSATAYDALAQSELAQKEWPAAYAALRQTLDIQPNFVPARLDLAKLFLQHHEYRHAAHAARQVLRVQKGNPAARQALGAVAIATHHPRQALRQFQQLIRLRPNDPDAWINLALVEAGLRHGSAAATDLRHALTLNPHAVLAYRDLASLDMLRHHPAAAQACLRQGLQQNPQSISLYLALASLRYVPAQPQAAERVLSRMLQVRPHSARAALAAGEFYRSRGMISEAMQTYRTGLDSHAGNLPLSERLLDLYISTRQWAPAKNLDAALLRQHPDNLTARLCRARLLLAQKQPGTALLILRKLVAQNPGSAPARYDLGLAYWETGMSQAGIHEVEMALRAQPKSAACLQLLARMWLARGNVSAAQRYAAQFAAVGGDPALSRRLLGRIALQQHQYRKALTEFRAAGLEPSPRAQDHVLLAQAAAGAGQFALAKREFGRALALAPQSSRILGLAVHYYSQRKQWAEAQRLIASFTAAHPKDPHGPWLLGTLQLSLNRNADARQSFHRALLIQPGFVAAELDLGRMNQASGNLPRALHRYLQALRSQPNFAPLLTLVGNLYLQQEQLPAAAEYYRKALRAQPGFALAEANLAWIYARQGHNLPRALALAQQAVHALPNLDSVSDTLAWVYYKMGSYGAAIPLLRHCVQTAPAYPMYHYQLGMALLAAGHRAASVRQLRQALALKLPAHEASLARIALLRRP